MSAVAIEVILDRFLFERKERFATSQHIIATDANFDETGMGFANVYKLKACF